MAQDLIFKFAKNVRTPREVQKLLHTLSYNKAATLQSALTSLQKHTAHCLEGVFVAAAILEHHGFEPWVLSLESQDGLDHCLYVYQQQGLWGSIGKSRDTGLNGRAPIYKTLKDLAKSYFDPYVDNTGRITAWQTAHLDEVNVDWRKSQKNVWTLEKHLLEIPHHPLTSSDKKYQFLLKRYQEKGDLKRRPHWW